MAGHFADRIGDNMDLTSLSDDDLAAHHICYLLDTEPRSIRPQD